MSLPLGGVDDLVTIVSWSVQWGQKVHDVIFGRPQLEICYVVIMFFTYFLIYFKYLIFCRIEDLFYFEWQPKVWIIKTSSTTDVFDVQIDFFDDEKVKNLSHPLLREFVLNLQKGRNVFFPNEVFPNKIFPKHFSLTTFSPNSARCARFSLFSELP